MALKIFKVHVFFMYQHVRPVVMRGAAPGPSKTSGKEPEIGGGKDLLRWVGRRKEYMCLCENIAAEDNASESFRCGITSGKGNSISVANKISQNW